MVTLHYSTLTARHGKTSRRSIREKETCWNKTEYTNPTTTQRQNRSIHSTLLSIPTLRVRDGLSDNVCVPVRCGGYIHSGIRAPSSINVPRLSFFYIKKIYTHTAGYVALCIHNRNVYATHCCCHTEITNIKMQCGWILCTVRRVCTQNTFL